MLKLRVAKPSERVSQRVSVSRGVENDSKVKLYQAWPTRSEKKFLKQSPLGTGAAKNRALYVNVQFQDFDAVSA